MMITESRKAAQKFTYTLDKPQRLRENNERLPCKDKIRPLHGDVLFFISAHMFLLMHLFSPLFTDLAITCVNYVQVATYIAIKKIVYKTQFLK